MKYVLIDYVIIKLLVNSKKLVAKLWGDLKTTCRFLTASWNLCVVHESTAVVFQINDMITLKE